MPTGSRWLIAVLAAVVIVVAGGVWYWFGAATSVQPLRIGTGGAGGTYYPLGQGLAEVFNAELPDRVRAEVLETSGSSDNAQRLEAGEVEMAIVQNDTEVGADVRAIAPLYPEVLQVVVRAEVGIESLRDVWGHPMSAGPEGSGTDVLASRVLEHFGMAEYADTLVHCSTSQAVERFEGGEIDGAFLVSGLKSSAVARLLSGEGRLLSLGDPAQVGSALDGLRVSHPFLSRSVIPARTYGNEPVAPVGSVAVQAVLVARADLDARLVHDLTGTIFENRVGLIKAHRAAAHLTEQFDPSALQAPLHDGAERYYRRDAPPFYVAYAEFMSLLLTLCLAGASAFLAVRRWVRRTKKDRIDVYYVDIQTLMQRWERGELDGSDAIDALVALRSRAFEELVEERLAADQSFTIFQDYVTTEMSKLERASAQGKRPAG
jgi:TRAP transporter TAXI family solute receptor